MKNLLLVFTNAVDDRHEDLNDWYTNVHIRDVMRMPASIAVQRFILADEQVTDIPHSNFRYLAMYETDDTIACTAAHAVAMTPKLPISDAFDAVGSPCNYYRLRSFVTADPLATSDGDIVVAEFADHASFDLTAASRLVGRDRVLSVAHLGVMGDQLIPRDPIQPELALFRLSGVDAPLGALDVSAAAPGASIVTHYRPLIRRLTATAVLDANAEEQALEARSRAALEGRQHQLPA